MRNPKDCIILVPCNGGIEFKTDEALRELEKRGYEVYRQTGWSAIDQARNRMAYDAIYRKNFKEVLWIDADSQFHPDDVEKIRSHSFYICGGAYPMKGWPVMTFQPNCNQKVVFSKNSEPVEVAVLATGFLFTRVEVFNSIKYKFNLKECNSSFNAPQIPFFQPGVWQDPKTNKHYYFGEDFSFCIRAKQCGYKIMLDPSIKLGHIGKYTYTWEDVINQTGKAPKANNDMPFTYQPIEGLTEVPNMLELKEV